jgi:ABC-2 type transport system ATP-binding protein
MIEIDGLTKVFKGLFGAPFTAVDEISFEVSPKDIFGFLGPNGAGKTTTIKMLTTILPPTKGTARVQGFDILKRPHQVKRHIGFMPEKPGFYEEMNPVDLLRFYGEFYRMSRSQTKVKTRELLDMTGLFEFRKRKVRYFSHGMRKRMALCQCLMHDPEILILDEPTGGLDPEGTHEFRELIKGLRKQGKTIFLSSHLLSEVQQVCNQIGIIYKGRIIDVGPLRKVEKRAGAEAIFITLKGRGFKNKILEELMDNNNIKFIKPKRKRGEEELKVYLEDKARFKVNKVSSEVVEVLVQNGAKVSAVLPPEMDLEEAFLALVKKKGGGK